MRWEKRLAEHLFPFLHLVELTSRPMWAPVGCSESSVCWRLAFFWYICTCSGWIGENFFLGSSSCVASCLIHFFLKFWATYNCTVIANGLLSFQFCFMYRHCNICMRCSFFSPAINRFFMFDSQFLLICCCACVMDFQGELILTPPAHLHFDHMPLYWYASLTSPPLRLIVDDAPRWLKSIIPYGSEQKLACWLISVEEVWCLFPLQTKVSYSFVASSISDD